MVVYIVWIIPECPHKSGVSQCLYACLCSHRCSMCISASSSRSVAVCVRSGGVLLGVGEHQALGESIRGWWLQSNQLRVTLSHLRQQRAEIHPEEQRQTFRQLQKRPLLCDAKHYRFVFLWFCPIASDASTTQEKRILVGTALIKACSSVSLLAQLWGCVLFFFFTSIAKLNSRKFTKLGGESYLNACQIF